MPDALYLEAGVEVFFVLSGFLIYSPFVRAHLAGDDRPRLGDYVRRRLLRIYPAYWVAVGVLMALGWVFVDSTPRLFSELTLTQGYRTFELMGDEGLQPAWTLCVEVTFYAFVPMCAALVRPLGRRVGVFRAEVAGALILVAVGVACLAWSSWGVIWAPLGVLSPNLPTLGAGMLLAVVAAARPTRPGLDRLARWVPPALVCWPLAFVALLCMPGRPTTWPAPAHQWFVADLTQSLFGVLMAVPIMVGAAGVVGRFLRLGPVSWVGLVSYGIYLWHYDLVYDLWPEAWQAGRSRALAAAAGLFALSVAFGAASHHLVERPAQAWGRRIERRRRAQAAAPCTRQAAA
jgi:peptidoglycan/LPS O-acetylase OafA/YrhL